MSWFTDFLGYIPGVGQAVDLFGSIFGFDDVGRTNKSNQEIAQWNIEAQKQANLINRQNVIDTNNANKALADSYNANQVQLQNSMNNFNKEMWNVNNQYNSPTAQLQRASDAGINPNIVFGQPIASSPVQQTSIPQQQLAQMQSYRQDALHNDFKLQVKTMEKLGKLMNSIKEIPFINEDFKAKQLDNKSKKLDNDIKEYNLNKEKSADDMYGGNAFYVATDGSDRMLTADEFDRLSDNEKKAFLDKDMPYREINGEKIPNYNGSRLPFNNSAQFKAYKDIMNLPNFLQNIRADNLQSKLREAIAKEQLSAKDSNGNYTVVYRLAHMPEVQYNHLHAAYKRLQQQNDWFDETKDIEKEILDLNKQQVENAVGHDFFSYIDKIGSDDMSTADYIKMFLVGLHDALSGASSFVRKR